MRILFLTQILPYPPDAGPRIKTWHVLRYLAERGDQVTLVTYIRPEEIPYLPQVQAICEQVCAIPIQRSRIADIGYWLRSLQSGRPFLIERDDLAPMRQQVEQILRGGQIDVIHADQLTMTQFALPRGAFARGSAPVEAGGPRLVFDAHNATWTILDRLLQTSRFYFKPLLALECQRLKRYEGQLVARFEHTLAVTEIDRLALNEAAQSTSGVVDGRVQVIPIAIDTRQNQPVQRQPGSLNILTLGTLHYPPNAGGIRWFMQEVFPIIQQRVPGVTLTVVGKNPPKDFLRMARDSQGTIEVTGYVKDLSPYLERAGVMVVPVLAGGGMRVRILEAFAKGLPLVTTTIGLEGIDAAPGQDVLVEDSPGRFAAAVASVLGDPQLQAKLIRNGRALVENRYDWQVVLRQLDEVYQAEQPVSS